MKIGIIGDVHGRVFHAVAAVVTWQRVARVRFDLLLQVGDMGAYPETQRMDSATKRHLAVDPSEADFSRLLDADRETAASLLAAREQLKTPIYFVRGNHEDQQWLDGLFREPGEGGVRVDPFDLFRYVPDGAIVDFEGLRVAAALAVLAGRATLRLP